MDQFAVDPPGHADGGGNVSSAHRILLEFTACLYHGGWSGRGARLRSPGRSLEVLEDTSDHRSQEGQEQDR